MPRPPSIDVLLPVRRARRTLPGAVGDVLAQRDVALRLITVVQLDEDGRDDGSADWIFARARSDGRLIVIPAGPLGTTAALETALAAAEAPLVSHMEADDRCPPDRLARLAARLERGDVAAVTSRAGQCGARTPGMRRYLDWQNGLLTAEAMAAGRFVEIPALHQTGLYRREALASVGGYRTRGPWPADIDFWFRWFEHELPVVKVPRVLYRWRQHPGQSTRTAESHARATLRAAKIDALARLHGRRGRRPRPVRLVSTGATLAAWTAALGGSELELVEALAWRPGRPPPPLEDGVVLLAVYGMPGPRAALRAALPAARETETLLFAA